MASIPTVGQLVGGLEIAICGALILYGLCTAQAYIYMLNSKDDHKLLRVTVLAVWLLETAHTVFLIHVLYHYTITSFGNLLDVNFITWSIGVAFASELVIIVLVQSFYIRRVWILSDRSYVLTGITALLLLARTAFGLGTSVLLYMVPTWSEFHSEHGPMTTISGGLSFSVAVDFVIAAILVFYLRRGQSETNFSKTHDIIRICMVYAVNTGALTMIVSILILVTFILVKNSLLFAGLALIASKLYANSFLGTLNARHLLRRKNDTSNRQQSRATGSHSHTLRQIEIYQQTTKTVEHDNGRAVTFHEDPLAEIYKAADLDGSLENSTPMTEHYISDDTYEYKVAV